MKKFLSLVLALVMTMSLVTISAGAKDFTDADKTTYVEAVDVMSAVKVIDGYADGSFNPTATLTRGAAAKIICNLILGPTTANALVADAAPFSDVPANSTFAGYITYCAKEGIVGGYADGTFKPGNTLTGYAFMKMLLGALGYDADVEGYNTPGSWSISVAKQALGIGLDDGLVEDFDGTKPVTREQACLYALNTLTATMVEYEAKTSVNVGDATVVIAGSKAKEVENKDVKDNTIKNDGKLQFAEKFFSNLKLDDADDDDFGRPCRTWTLKNKDIGTYSKTAELVATYTKKVKKTDIYEAIGKSVADDLYDGDATLYNYVDGVGGKIAKSDVKKSFVEKNNTDKINKSGNGMLTEVYYDDDANIVTIVAINTYVFQASTDYNTTKESVEVVAAGDTLIMLDDRTLDQDDFDVENVKADDYLLITGVKQENGAYTVKSVAPAEIVTGNVSSYKLNDSVTIDGTEYSYSLKTTKAGDDDATTEPVKTTQFTVGQDAAVVLDSYGYIIAVDKAVVSDNYLYVSEFAQPSGLSSGKVVASAYFTDGTTDDITVKELKGSSDKKTIMGTVDGNGKYTRNSGWYTFSKNSNGEYNLYAVEKKFQTANSKPLSYAHPADTNIMVNNKVTFLTNDASLKADDKTIVIVDDENGDVSVYTGVKNIPDITLNAAAAPKVAGTANGAVLAKSNGYASYVFIDVDGNASIAGGEDTSLVYYVKYDGQYKTTDNDVYHTYKILTNGKEEVVKADTTLSVGIKDVYKAVYKTRTNSDGEITSVENNTYNGKFAAGSGSAITYSNGTLNLDNKGYTLADNYQITMVVKKSANALNKDKDADYQASIVTAKELADRLKGYTVTYNYQLKTTTTGGTVLEDLYVTVTSATDPADAKTVTISGDATPTVVSDGTAAGKVITVSKGTDLKFTLAADNVGEKVAKVTVGGVELKADATGVYTIENVSKDTTVTVETADIVAVSVYDEVGVIVKVNGVKVATTGIDADDPADGVDDYYIGASDEIAVGESVTVQVLKTYGADDPASIQVLDTDGAAVELYIGQTYTTTMPEGGLLVIVEAAEAEGPEEPATPVDGVSVVLGTPSTVTGLNRDHAVTLEEALKAIKYQLATEGYELENVAQSGTTFTFTATKTVAGLDTTATFTYVDGSAVNKIHVKVDGTDKDVLVGTQIKDLGLTGYYCDEAGTAVAGNTTVATMNGEYYSYGKVTINGGAPKFGKINSAVTGLAGKFADVNGTKTSVDEVKFTVADQTIEDGFYSLTLNGAAAGYKKAGDDATATSYGYALVNGEIKPVVGGKIKMPTANAEIETGYVKLTLTETNMTVFADTTIAWSGAKFIKESATVAYAHIDSSVVCTVSTGTTTGFFATGTSKMTAAGGTGTPAVVVSDTYTSAAAGTPTCSSGVATFTTGVTYTDGAVKFTYTVGTSDTTLSITGVNA